MESRTIGHYRPLNEAKAAAQRDHDQNRDQGRWVASFTIASRRATMGVAAGTAQTAGLVLQQ
jgi:hypothetical protein